MIVIMQPTIGPRMAEGQNRTEQCSHNHLHTELSAPGLHHTGHSPSGAEFTVTGTVALASCAYISNDTKKMPLSVSPPLSPF